MRYKILLSLVLSGLAYAQPSGNATALQGRRISPTAPADTNVLAWDAATSRWKPTTAGGGSLAFSAITAGTNTAALVIGTGGSLGVSGSGTINATSLGGVAAASYALLAGPTFTGKISIAAIGAINSTGAGAVASGAGIQYTTPRLTGTGTITVVDLALTGTGTAFLTQVHPGYVLYVGTDLYAVLTVTDNTHLVLSAADADVAGASYTIEPPSIQIFKNDGGLALQAGAINSFGANTVTGFNGFALGIDNTISGLSAVAVGTDNNISGRVSFAIGDANAVTGNGSTAIGVANSISGFHGVAMGSAMTVTADEAFGVNLSGGPQTLATTGMFKIYGDVSFTGRTQIGTVAFASLGTPSDGSEYNCSDCTVTSGSDNTCAASGTGAFAERINGAWKCDQ